MSLYNSTTYNGAAYNSDSADVRQARVLSKPRIAVEIQYTGYEIDTKYNTAEVSNQNRFTKLSDLWTGQVMEKRYFALDGYSKLDGSYILPSNLYEFGWWSGTVCDNNGVFQEETSVTLHFVTSVFYNVVLGFGVDDYATDFVLTFFLDNDEVLTKTITNNDLNQLNVRLEEPVMANKLTLKILKWSRPHTVAKVSELWTRYSEFYHEDMLLNVQLSKIVDSENLYIGKANELQVTLWNDGRWDMSQKLYSIAKQNRIVTLYAFSNDLTDAVVLFRGLSAKMEVRSDKTVQVLAQGPLAQIVDVDGDYPTKGIATNVEAKDIVEILMQKAKEKIPWLEYVNNVPTGVVLPFYWNRASVRFGIEQLATAKGFAMRERNNVLVIGDTQSNEWFIDDDLFLGKSIDRNWNLTTRYRITVTEMLRRKRNVDTSVTVQPNEETVVSFSHGRLFVDPTITIEGNATIRDVKSYVDHTDVYIKANSVGGNVVVHATIDELATIEDQVVVEHPKILEYGPRGQEVSGWRYMTFEDAQRFGNTHLIFEAEELKGIIPLNLDLDVDDKIVHSGAVFRVMEVKHEFSSNGFYTSIFAKAIVTN